MVCRDRTLELAQIVGMVHPATATAAAAKPAPTSSQSSRDFLKHAEVVNKDLATTSHMLTTLTQLMRQKNTFDDHSAEIEELSGAIKGQLATTKQHMGTLNTLKSSALGRKRTTVQADQYAEGVATSLHSGMRQLAVGFNDVLQQRSSEMATTQGRRRQFTDTSDNAVLLRHDEGDHQTQLQMYLPNQNLSYYNSRLSEVKQVEKSIDELAGLFREFAQQLAEQGEAVVRIDEETSKSLTHVEGGHSELLKYLRNASSNRMLLLKIFATLFAFITFFGMFIL